MVQSVLRWYIGQCELRSLKVALHHILNLLAHIAQCTPWGLFAPYFKRCSSHFPMYHMRTICTIFKLLSSPCPMYHLRMLCCELRNLNMVLKVHSWYIGQGELRSVNIVQRVLRWYIGPNVPPEDALHHILSFLAHLAQSTNWGCFAPYLNFLAHLRILKWCKESSSGILGKVS
jgi:hypothetical protein